MKNKCFNCKKFFSCKWADTKVANCDKFEPRKTRSENDKTR